MNHDGEKEISIDILRHVEEVSNKVNKLMASRADGVLKRYPITFGLLLLLGVIGLHEGLKGLLKNFGLLDINPWFLILAGLIILTITGSLYNKLEK